MAEQPPDTPLPENVAFVRVAQCAARARARWPPRFYPRQPRIIAAVTGTSGKTSVAAFTRQIWTALGHRAASIGTIGIVSPRGETYGSLTTPDPVALHRSLDALAGEGVTHLAIEASSHGLDQYRLDGLRIAAGGFTNITRDHLDYHPTFEAYLAAKLRLFEALLEPGARRGHRCRSRACRRGGRRRDGARLVDHQRRPQREQAFGLSNPPSTALRRRCGSSMSGKIYQVRSAAGRRIPGRECAGRRRACHRHRRRCRLRYSRRSNISAAPRAGSNCVGTSRGAPIFVDYAHKPDALAKALDALRPYVTGRLVVVFGAGGDRDRGKRPLMGAVAADKADRVIVTDDNPRSEDAAAIRAAIIAAARAAPSKSATGARRSARRLPICAPATSC